MNVIALTYDGFVVRDEPKPICGPDQVLVKSLACGICDSDVVLYKLHKRSPKTDILLGHEGNGLVVEVGQNVAGFSVGEHVTTLEGAFAEYFCVNQNLLVKLPENLNVFWTPGEPVSCCVHAAKRFGICPGDRVAVLGCGFIGLVCLQLAKDQGASLMGAFDPILWRHDMAIQCGASFIENTEDKNGEQLAEEYGEFDVVIEATGVQAGIDLASDLVKEHGRIVVMGYHHTNMGFRMINMKQWNYKAIDVINGHVRRMDEKLDALRAGVEMMSQEQLIIKPLVQHYKSADITKAFNDLIDRKKGLFKAMIVFDGEQECPT